MIMISEKTGEYLKKPPTNNKYKGQFSCVVECGEIIICLAHLRSRIEGRRFFLTLELTCTRIFLNNSTCV